MEGDDVYAEFQRVFKKQMDKGMAKYGHEIDISSRSVTQWIDEAVEESVDNIIYLLSLKRRLIS